MTDLTTEKEADAAIEQAKQGCVERGEGLEPCHVYLEGATKCVCQRGPDLSERRMR